MRKQNPPSVSKEILDKMFSVMLPKGTPTLALSKMNMGEMGALMMKYVMNKKKMQSLSELMEQAKALGVTFLACQMSIDVMDIIKDKLIDGIMIGGLHLTSQKQSNLT